ncbi:MAG: hypothetical protein CM15mP70_13160 [Pelagibacteraceae bacterium]|nr:MAG: hypothetical protein CM15mP70_13160 [Pelagibacteraceae bacterium]
MAYGAGYYWTNISMAPSFSAALPFGLTAQEQNAWCYYGEELKQQIKLTIQLV